MARYRIEKSPESAVAIEVSEVGGQQDRVLAAFASCQAGQCSCPTDEYRKLESMSIDRGEDDITVRLEPKEGESFDLSQIAVCLEYVTAHGSPPRRAPRSRPGWGRCATPRSPGICCASPWGQVEVFGRHGRPRAR
jgi:hypothetical protein